MNLETLRKKQGFICDMDGVIYHGNHLLPGAKRFVNWLKNENKKFLFLTNSSERSPRELQEKLDRLGISVNQKHFYTSALATASFLASQRPNGNAYVIGEAGLINALYEVGYSMNEIDPDYVVVGETRSYAYEKIERAVNLVRNGAKLIGTNPDLTDSLGKGIADRTYRTCHWNRCLFCGKTQSADDASCDETAWLQSRGNRHYRRPHGYRYYCRNTFRDRYRTGSQRSDRQRRPEKVCLSPSLYSTHYR